MLASFGTLEDATPQVLEPENAVGNGGTHSPANRVEGRAARHRRRPGPAAERVYGLTTILIVLAFMTLARVRDPEQLRDLAPGEWELLLGLDRCPEVKTLREKIRLIAGSSDTVHQWQMALAERWAVA